MGEGQISALQQFIVITAIPVSLILPPSLYVRPKAAYAMALEDWRVTRVRNDLDEQGHGVVIYRLRTHHHTYHGVIFSKELDPDQRSGRVIAEAWDVTFALV